MMTAMADARREPQVRVQENLGVTILEACNDLVKYLLCTTRGGSCANPGKAVHFKGIS